MEPEPHGCTQVVPLVCNNCEGGLVQDSVKVGSVSPKLSTRKRPPDSEADGCEVHADMTSNETPSPSRSLRKSPRTPEILHPVRLRPRRLSFSEGILKFSKSSNDPATHKGSDLYCEKEACFSSQQVDPRHIKKQRQSPRLVERNKAGQEKGEKESIPHSVRRKDKKTALDEGRKEKAINQIKKERGRAEKSGKKPTCKKSNELIQKLDISTSKALKRKWLDHVVVDRIRLHVGDDVYVRRTEEDVLEEEEGCLACGKAGKLVECDACSRGVHLKCIHPPVKTVPEGEWYCFKCDPATKDGQSNKDATPVAPRTARELLLASKLWAARIEKLWKDEDGSYWFKGRWYLIPEETAVGRQPHNLRRELFLTDHVDENEVASILRKCYVMGTNEFHNSGKDGDDIFLCEYEYDTCFERFKRISDMDKSQDQFSCDELDNGSKHEDDSSDDDAFPARRNYSSQEGCISSMKPLMAANTRVGRIFDVIKVGTKTIPHSARRRPVMPFERAKAALRLTATPNSLPCREKEMKEIMAFVSDAVIARDNILGHCLYISGVPGTGKTATVLEVMQNIRRALEEKNVSPYCFVEINGLKLTSPEHLYTVLHEALTGHHVGWKKALHLLDERFSSLKPSRRVDARPCILLIDELDLLVTRNQSVLYNVFDWPTRPHSRLFVIGIANTIDLPERLLPRIASRMGLRRVSFSPYSHEQLQKIISSRLEAIDAFEKQAIEFASRKIAAVSGDARRALELCRRAVEIAEARLYTTSTSKNRSCAGFQGKVARLVGMKDVEEAIREMFQAPHIKIMGRCSVHAKLFLVAMVYEQHKTGMVETTFEKVAVSYSFLCRNNGEKPLDWDTLLSVGCALGACRLLLCEPGSRHRLQKLQLNFPTDDVSFALKEDKEVSWIGKYL